MEFGFAYVFAHPEWIPVMDGEIDKIRLLERLQSKSPVDHCQYERFLREAWIDYISKLSTLGFKYIKAHPGTFDEISELKKIFEEYEELRKDFYVAKILNKNKDNKKKTEPSESHQLKQLRQVLENFEEKLEMLHEPLPRTKRVSKEKLKKKNPPPLPRDEPSINETLKKFNQDLTNKMNELREQKMILRQQQEDFKAELSKEKKKKLRKTPPIPRNFIEDSDNNSSEFMISLEQFNKPVKNEKPRADPVERHLVIPIHAKEQPKIKPRFNFLKSPIDGSVQLDLTLNFDDGVLFQNKLVKGICIKNAFPVQNFRSKNDA